MRFRNKCGFWCIALLTGVGATSIGAGDTVADSSTTPQLEIRQYRFSRHGGTYERLVLEFARKDSNLSNTPKVHADRSANGEWNITVDNALLLGAIPESLINDSFASKSRLLGSISVDMDNARGFSVHANLKKGKASSVEAMWLDKPARLVIDTYAAGRRETSSVDALQIERSAKVPGFAQLVCFPAQARVGLTVVFQPDGSKPEELQNYRVNTDGIGGDGMPAPDAIHCYPKKTQIKAALSYEERKAGASAWDRPRDKMLLPPIPNAFRSALPPMQPMTPMPPMPPMRPMTPMAPPPMASLAPMPPMPPMAPPPMAPMPISPMQPMTSSLPTPNPMAPQAMKPMPMPMPMPQAMTQAPKPALSPLPMPLNGGGALPPGMGAPMATSPMPMAAKPMMPPGMSPLPMTAKPMMPPGMTASPIGGATLAGSPMPPGLTPVPPLKSASPLGLPIPTTTAAAPPAPPKGEGNSDLDFDPGPLGAPAGLGGFGISRSARSPASALPIPALPLGGGGNFGEIEPPKPGGAKPPAAGGLLPPGFLKK